MIPLQRPAFTGQELENVKTSLVKGSLAGQAAYTTKCEQWLERSMSAGKAFLTTSCTASLEMAALILDIQPEDEVILPSYTYVATVNAFILRGAVPVFVDVEPGTMNMDVSCAKAAITTKSRVIVPVHYGGVACDMDAVMDLAHQHDLFVVEDAAQAICSTYKGRALGTIGDIGCLSFHETKNVTAGGQGGATLVNKDSLLDRAEIVHDCGSDRARFRRGEIKHYQWQDIGANFLLSEILASVLWAQLEAIDDVQRRRHALWKSYEHALRPLATDGRINLLNIPVGCDHNAHIFWFKLQSTEQRDEFMRHMKARGVSTAPHYSPLHSTSAGLSLGRFHGKDVNTTTESARLVRLPLYTEMSQEEVTKVLTSTNAFFEMANSGDKNGGLS